MIIDKTSQLINDLNTSVVMVTVVYYHPTDQPLVMIVGETDIPEGGRLKLSCLLDDGTVPSAPQWTKNSVRLPAHVTLV